LWNGDGNMFNESMTYDINGNIKTLARNGKVNGATTTIDNLFYHYSSLGKSSSNALRHVVDKSNYWSGDPSFGYTETDITHANYVSEIDGQNNTEYDYYLDGNLKSDLNKEITKITYNHLDYPEKIQLSGNREIEYRYDAAGNKLKTIVKTTSPNTVLSEIDYAGAIQYYNGKLASLETVEGRVVRGATGYEYEYFIKDHQHNVRVVFGSGGKTASYLATMETVRATQENNDFVGIVREGTLNHTVKSASIPSPSQAVKLNAAIANGKAVGPSKKLIVKGGDNVQAEVFGRYTVSMTGINDLVANITSLVTTALGIPANGEPQSLYNTISNYLPGKAALIPKSGLYPKAYLCYVLLEKIGSGYTAKQFGYYEITDLALNKWQQLNLDVHVPESIGDGEMYIYVANETSMNANTSVFFDDLSIVHQSTIPTLQVYQTSDYYPFGLSFNSYETNRSYCESGTGNVIDVLGNSRLFQDQELQRGFDVGWYHYKFRMHDSALGRFSALDPLAEKYLYNSVYAFSENRLIDGIELEGGEYMPTFNTNIPYDDDWFVNGLNLFQNTFAPVFNIVPETWNSMVLGVETVHDEGWGRYGELMGGEFSAMGAGIVNTFIGQYDYAVNAPFSQQMSDTWEGFQHLDTYEAPAQLALGIFGPKNFSSFIKPSINFKPFISLGGSPKPTPTISLGSTSRVFEVGPYNMMRGLEVGLDAHHVGQQALMRKFVKSYNPNTAPSILVPKLGHTEGIGVLARGTKGFTNARDVLARDIFELRRVYPNVPNSSLQQLIQMNKTMYPNDF
jgi:hypothetical protein